jgi:hypothetical protein
MTINAQKAIVVSGGDISDANFSTSYSIGQTSQQKTQNASELLNQGVQQPFEIFSLQTLGVTDLPETNIKMLVYPNPAISYVNLSVSNLEIVDATYSLFNIQGKFLKKAKINALETLIEMVNYPVSTYFLKVQDNNGRLIKTFKIIKN